MARGHEGERKMEYATKVLSPDEFVRVEPEPLIVQEGTVLVLEPTNQDLSKYFATVALRTYEDLQTMGFMPRGIELQRIKDALQDDDDATRREVELRRNATEMYPRTGMRQQYNQSRREYHPALSRVLADHYGVSIAADSTSARTVWNWAKYVEVKKGGPILATLFQDITIHQDATLTVGKQIKTLFAGDIYIHETGTLVSLGSYLKIWASSITAFDGPTFINTAVIVKSPPWKLDIP